MNDYDAHDALGLADLVRRGEISPGELLEAALQRVERDNPTLNAVVTPLYDAARRAIANGLPDGPFKGVPFLVKELVASVAGAATTASSRLYAHNMATIDSEIVARFRRAGLVIAGKTNSPEFGLSPTTESHLYGTTRNPWRLDLAPGGSSGGSAAAVAGRHGAHGPCDRRRRLHSHPRVVLRPVRPQADARAHHRRSRRR